MKIRFNLIVIALFSLVQIVAAQAPKASAKAWNPPRMASGQPDLQGIWNYSTLTPIERPRELAGKAFFQSKKLPNMKSEHSKAVMLISIAKPRLPPAV